jgi:hypothetical protein
MDQLMVERRAEAAAEEGATGAHTGH